MESEWIEWAGGECPVDELVRVECIFRAPPLTLAVCPLAVLNQPPLTLAPTPPAQL